VARSFLEQRIAADDGDEGDRPDGLSIRRSARHFRGANGTLPRPSASCPLLRVEDEGATARVDAAPVVDRERLDRSQERPPPRTAASADQREPFPTRMPRVVTPCSSVNVPPPRTIIAGPGSASLVSSDATALVTAPLVPASRRAAAGAPRPAADTSCGPEPCRHATRGTRRSSLDRLRASSGRARTRSRRPQRAARSTA
jgi:hypothetical protein